MKEYQRQHAIFEIAKQINEKNHYQQRKVNLMN